MRVRQAAVILGLVGGLSIVGGPGAYAQGCIGIIMRYVGKPLLKQMVEEGAKKGGTLIVQHFAAKLSGQNGTSGNGPGHGGASGGNQFAGLDEDENEPVARATPGNHQPLVLTNRDVAELQQAYEENGKSVCELRRDIQAMFNGGDFGGEMPQPPMPPASMPPPAAMCMTPMGSCMMMMPVPIGSSCTCSGIYGIFPGIAR